MTTAADRRKLNKDAGFSLLELLIAVVILAIIVIPLLNLFLSSNRLNIKSRQTLRATTAAQDIMEGLKAYNIEEIRTQFDKPADGFYVIDSRLIKGGVAEETTLEVDGADNAAPGLYVFSMKELNMQGSKFDAKIVVDARGYMDPARFASHSHIYEQAFFDGEKCTMCGAFKADRKHDGIFNDAALADARSIDKENGTFVESTKIRRAVLDSVFKNTNIKSAVKAKLKASGVADADLDDAYESLWKKNTPLSANYVCYKNAPVFFDQISREIIIDLSVSGEVDENGDPKADMVITQKYMFHYKDINGIDIPVTTYGDIDTGIVVDKMPGGSIARTEDGKLNVNIFYYPLYGAAAPDKIIINNDSGLDLNLLIAKQRYEKLMDDPANPGQKLPDLSDPEYLSDPQLLSAELLYHVDVEVNEPHFDKDKFTLKTNLGLNLVGEKYLAGAPGTNPEIPAQFTVNGTHMDLSGTSGMNIFTLDGVRSPMGKDPDPGEVTELIYDVEVSVYEEGAAASGFPLDKRMVVIQGGTTN